MRRLLWLIFALPQLLLGDWDGLFKESSDPAWVHNVNVVTGTLQLAFEDHRVEGVVPIHLVRTYSSSGADERSYRKDSDLKNIDLIWQLEGGWELFPHLQLLVDPRRSGETNLRVYAKEPSGEMIAYDPLSNESKHVAILKPEKKRGPSSGIISGRLNPNNHRLRINYKEGTAVIYLADGGKRIYKGDPRGWKDKILDYNLLEGTRDLRHYLLQEEIFPSGQRTLYQYSDDGQQIQILQCNPTGTKVYSWISIRQANKKPPFCVSVSTSDNRTFRYDGVSFEKEEYLSAIHSPLKPSETISYAKRRHALERITSLNKELLYVKYQEPAHYVDGTPAFGTDKVQAIYEGGSLVAIFTYAPGVTDVRDCNQILTRYHHNEENGLFLIEHFENNDEPYSSEKFFWENGNLVKKSMCDNQENTLFSKLFFYDDFGNVVQETLESDLGQYSKWYEYDPSTHLLMEEREENGLTHTYTYLEGTDLVLTKLRSDGAVVEFTYDNDHLLIQEKSDHFEKTYTRDPRTGMILKVDDGLSKVQYSYSHNLQIIKEETPHYSIEFDYDNHGRLIYKSTPCGNENRYLYDAFGNVVSSKEVGSPEKRFSYDQMNRPTSCTVNGKTTYTSYDAKGFVASTTNHLGLTTTYTYDPFGRTLSICSPFGVKVEFQYDLLGNPILYKNPNGAIKRSSYNVFCKPTEEIFPDGSRVKYLYHPNGTLKETIHQDGSKTPYTYDILGRLTHTKNEEWVYSPTHLLSYTDPTGLTTTYTYDEYGRKIEEVTLDRKTTCTYDDLGFLESTTISDITHTEIHDEEGRIVEEIENGENHTFYTYDEENRKVQISKNGAIDLIKYDVENRVVRHIDPYQNETQFLYDDYTKTTIDPVGNISIETFDYLGRLIQIEKKTPDQKPVFLEKCSYDKNGNLSKKTSYIYEGTEYLRKKELSWKYDLMDRVIQEQESDKISYHEYDVMGRLIHKTLPNGVTLSTIYDDEGHVSEFISSDGTIHYQYTYGIHLSPIQINDLIHNTTLKRSYNPFGQVIQEGSLKWEYDSIGREKSLTLPDQSKIAYEYVGKHMKKVSRFSSQGNLLYEHTYDAFDTSGHVSEESLITKLGKVHTQHDLLERAIHVTSPFHTISTSFGPSGLVASTENSLSSPKHYEYDSLNQLIKEEDQEYHFDSLGNPTDLTINEYNQLIDAFLYDKSGNPIKRLEDSTQYEYDALGRLTTILDTNGRKVSFLYDAYSRLLSKTVLQDNKQIEKRFYLYDLDFEIGSIDEAGHILDLRALGLGIEKDIGAAIAIEINGEIYAPLHDFQGNIIALLSTSGDLVATYNYDAFGKEDSDDFLIPWRFASKRTEEDLIYFGKRFYDPSYGRWLTPDPLGFFESANPYLYVLNSPLNRLDLFGLLSVGIYFEFDNIEHWEAYTSCRNGLLKPIICKAFLSDSPSATPVDCIIISGLLHKMHFAPEEFASGEVNLLNHFDELVPKQQGIIGLITAENGIGTATSDFAANCRLIMSNVSEGTTLVGLHNRSEGTDKDVSRTIVLELGHRIMTPNAIQTGLFIGAIADSLKNIESESYWLHVPHSEAGVLLNLGYTMLSNGQKGVVQKQMIVFAVAPAEPIPWKNFYAATNIYSNKDTITGWCGQKYKDNSDYDIRFIKCKSKRREYSAYLADHAFTGTTYRNATRNKFNDLRRDYRFYDSKKR